MPINPIFLIFSFFFFVATDASTTNHSENILHRQTRQSSSCYYEHTFSNIYEWISLRSEFYPNSYTPKLNCGYRILAPKGTQIILECNEFNVEYSQNCAYDKFYWSPSGDSNFRDARFACGTTPIKQTTSSNVLTAGFISDESNPTGTFKYSCTITVVPQNCLCGVSGASTKIVGGKETARHEFPWRVALFNNIQGYFCTGSIISQNYVMTAAHCTNENGPLSSNPVWVDVGDHNLKTNDEALKNEFIPVQSIMQNSLYNDRNQDHDIALLRLSRPLTYSQNIQPVCLPWKFTGANFEGVYAAASGWGTTSFGGRLSDVLQKTSLKVHNTVTCKQIYRNTNVEITDNMICANETGKDTCQSDSGGSLDYLDPNTNRYSAIGVVSYGLGCAEEGFPGIYTQLVKYLGWIEQNSGETLCKNG